MDRELKLQRYSDNGDSTQGILIEFKDSKESFLHGYTLEDEHRNVKLAGETRVNAGRYELKLNKWVDAKGSPSPLTQRYRLKYPWFKWHIEITKIPNFTGVYIHIGNKDGDTEGCILLGDSVDNNNISEGVVSNSTVCFQRFYKDVFNYLEKGNQIFINIVDEIGLK